MMRQRYRFYVIQNDTIRYLSKDWDSLIPDRRLAALFTKAQWDDWAEEQGFEREEIGEDEMMKLIGAPMLPGLEA